MHVYNLIEYNDTYSKISGNLYQYYRDEPTLNDNGNVSDFSNDIYNSISSKFKQKITEQTGNDGTKDAEI